MTKHSAFTVNWSEMVLIIFFLTLKVIYLFVWRKKRDKSTIIWI